MGEWLTEAEAAEHCRVGRPEGHPQRRRWAGERTIEDSSVVAPSEKSGFSLSRKGYIAAMHDPEPTASLHEELPVISLDGGDSWIRPGDPGYAAAAEECALKLGRETDPPHR